MSTDTQANIAKGLASGLTGTQVSSDFPGVGVGLAHALKNAGVTVFCQDLNLRILWIQNVPEIWQASATAGATDLDFLLQPTAERLVEAKRAVIAGGGPSRLEISVPDANSVRWFEVWIDADRDAAGTVRGLFTTAVETTQQKLWDQTLRALLREVSHRSKNLLAIIQSIASQTGRYSLTIDGFLTRFRGRIQSLASSQDLVTSSNWRGADLHELVCGQVARYSASPQQAVRFEGEKPWLNPNAALHVGLALHELAVNSVSYGALSRPGGFITVSANLDGDTADAKALRLNWAEVIGRPEDIVVDSTEREKRFGSMTLERVVPASLNGTASLEIGAGRLEYSLIIPSGNFEVD